GGGEGGDRMGFFVGTSPAGILQTELAYRCRDGDTGALPADFDYARTHNIYSLADFVRTRLRLAGPAHTVSSACATTAKVFANAARMIAAGVCDAAVVGGPRRLCGTAPFRLYSPQVISA